ncbi:ataxin-2-like protein isoform X2 [Senna tora]|uniref:Ataxin-2-like protein isoform X2 n=1 Tax=Senna tora TaxID=362788 RepID=A0A834U2P2_9FABA|nr:ataxin-2-like protein isoform X2 [Senna tora]
MNHVQFPKHQGGTIGQAMPLCVPPPVLASGQQPFALPNHIPLLQPSFPATRPIPVPGPNGFYGTKFS